MAPVVYASGLNSISFYCKVRLIAKFSLTNNQQSVASHQQTETAVVEETGVPWENQQSVASHQQTYSHNVVLSRPFDVVAIDR
jgi:hypothetical protein